MLQPLFSKMLAQPFCLLSSYIECFSFQSFMCGNSVGSRDLLIIWNFLEFQWLILFLHPSSPPFFIIFQVSREHYQRVKNSMKHNSNSIQPRSLSNVLGDMENLHVQPFEFYEEEERQKLHDHWLVLWSKTFLLVYQCFPHQFIVCVCTGCTWQTEMSLLVLQTGYRDVHRDCK